MTAAPTVPPVLFVHGEAVVDTVLCDQGMVDVRLVGDVDTLTPADRDRLVTVLAEALGVDVAALPAATGRP